MVQNLRIMKNRRTRLMLDKLIASMECGEIITSGELSCMISTSHRCVTSRNVGRLLHECESMKNVKIGVWKKVM